MIQTEQPRGSEATKAVHCVKDVSMLAFLDTDLVNGLWPGVTSRDLLVLL